MTRVRFAVPVGDYCIIIVDTGQTDLSVKMNAKIENSIGLRKCLIV